MERIRAIAPRMVDRVVPCAIKTFALKFANDWTMNLASMLAYSLITAILPLLLFILSMAALLLQPFVQANIDTVVAAITAALPRPVQSLIDVKALLNSLVAITGPLAISALIGLVWLGSNLFVNVENAFSIIYRVRGRAVIPQRLVAIGMVLLLTLLLPLSLLAASLVAAESSDLGKRLPPVLAHLPAIVGLLTSLGVLWLLFVVVYLVVPNTTVPLRSAWRGALVAAVLFGTVQVLFPLYFTVFLSGNAKYGAAALSYLVVIIWLWFFALFTLVGAQVTAVAMGLKELPADLARTVEVVYEQLHPEGTAVDAAHAAEQGSGE
jgi:membrane protein